MGGESDITGTLPAHPMGDNAEDQNRGDGYQSYPAMAAENRGDGPLGYQHARHDKYYFRSGTITASATTYDFRHSGERKAAFPMKLQIQERLQSVIG